MDGKKTTNESLIITIGNANYSLPVSDVKSVISLQRSAISPLPFDTSGKIRGIFKHRGSVIALVRSDRLVAKTDKNGSESLTAVILKNNNKRFAILVDKAHSIVTENTEKDSICLNVQKLYSGEKNDDY